jgi:tetratricopeptide (TPR) repeat protein
VLVEYEAGDFDQGRSYLDRYLESVQLNSPGPTVPYAFLATLIPQVARISGVMDRFDIAETAADAVLSSPTAAPGVVALATHGRAWMSVQRGDVSAAREQYTALESRQSVSVTSGSTVIYRLLGLLSQTMGNLDQAALHFEDALAFNRKAGYRPELAWSCCDYADVLRGRDAEGDRTKAITLLDESLAISSELGMRPLMERVLSRREILGA